MRRIIGATLVAGVLVLSGCSDGSESSPAEDAATASSVREELAKEVKLFVTGRGTIGADLTISVGEKDSQQSGMGVPLKNRSGEDGLTYEAIPGDLLYFVAQRTGGSSGEITCRIEVDGKVIDESTSSGPYASATCEGSTPG